MPLRDSHRRIATLDRNCRIRDVLFAHDICGTVNYFDAPEIVEDFGCKEHYQLHTVPCVVKFVDQWTDTKTWTLEKALGTALLYAYCDHHNKELNSFGSELNYPFDGKGLPVPKENILVVQKSDNLVDLKNLQHRNKEQV